MIYELAEEFRSYTEAGGQVFISTHSPDFVNGVQLEELFWLVKVDGYSQIKHIEISIKKFNKELLLLFESDIKIPLERLRVSLLNNWHPLHQEIL